MKNFKKLFASVLSVMLVFQMIPTNLFTIYAQDTNIYGNDYVEITTDNASSKEESKVDESTLEEIELFSHVLSVQVIVDDEIKDTLEIPFNEYDPGKTVVKALEGYSVKEVTLDGNAFNAEGEEIAFNANGNETRVLKVVLTSNQQEEKLLRSGVTYGKEQQIELKVGETTKLECDSKWPWHSHSWSSSDTDVASIVGDDDGKKVTITALKKGTTIIYCGENYAKKEIATITVKADESVDGTQKAVFYILKPGIDIHDPYDDENWYNADWGTVKNVAAINTLNIGKTYYDVNNRIASKPTNFPHIEYKGKEYRYVETNDSGSYESGTYTIKWERIVVSNGANPGINKNKNATVSTDIKTYHVDGTAELHDVNTYSVMFYVKDANEEGYGPPKMNLVVDAGTLHKDLRKPETLNQTENDKNYVFDGWYTDEACTKAADLSTGEVNSEEKYYGKYELDEDKDGTPDKYEATITYEVVNGHFEKDDKNVKTITQDYVLATKGKDGTWIAKETKLENIPTPNATKGYKAGSWDTIPTTATKVEDDEVYTYTFVKDETQWFTVKYQAGSNGTLTGTTKYEDVLVD
ncbi:MAG: hypothetical protein EOM50_13130, partial [Erysipelotrichia bacterium]|nr:hypothetical protein [Erysipelotrichia bacterium]NCC55702.1 hypothetical protein [Erysipelotrichia bacterium]